MTESTIRMTIATTIRMTETTVATTVAIRTETTIAHAMFTPIPWAKAAVSVRAHPKGIGGLHWQNGSTSDQGGGKSF